MTKDEIEDYIDNYISHIVASVEYGNFFASQIKVEIEKTKERINKVLEHNKRCTTKKSLFDIKKEINNILLDLENTVNDFVLEQINDVVEKENEWLNENVSSALDIKLDKNERLKNNLLLIPLTTVGIIGSFGTTLKSRLESIYYSMATSSYISGGSFEDLKDDYKIREQSFDRGVQADAETLGSSISSQYDRMVYTKNDTKIQCYIWLAILDSNTCLVCADLDHTKYSKIEDVPLYAKHDRCRCQVIPITSGMEDFIPDSYEKWFEKQDFSTKKSILGKNRFELYENGMKIKQFVNNGKITPLKELKKKV